jgi:hypothetical protein
VTDEVSEFFGEYPPAVRDVALELRRTILETIPDADETVDRSGRIVGYGYSPAYADLICVIIPSKTGVKLGMPRGARLPDPDGLLEGRGKAHRYVVMARPSDAKRRAVKRLLKAGVAAWKE